MEYLPDPALEERVAGIIKVLGMGHIDPGRVRILRSRGSRSRRTLARIHSLTRALQAGLNLRAHYVIEIISENFDPLSGEEKTKTIIHELMHIPAGFGGGFRSHRPYVTSKTVERMYDKYKESIQI